MNAVHGDKKKHNEWIARSFNNLYSPQAQVATGLEARWCGERTGSGSLCSGRGATRAMHPLDSSVADRQT